MNAVSNCIPCKQVATDCVNQGQRVERSVADQPTRENMTVYWQ
jgi:hypothetical protein